MKILIVGASGFMGTNLLEFFYEKGYKVLNIDKNEPKIKKRRNLWKKIDITDYKSFEKAVLGFNPDYILHMAARTDLDGKTLLDYKANTLGTENLMKIIHKLPNLKKVIISSSKFVAKNGYIIKNKFDYCPDTIYGESKAETEKIVWADKPHSDWCIIRPTSIWGPYFSEPYYTFFKLIMKRMYFHFGNRKCYKTYGYIGNAVYQISQLLFTETLSEDNKVFYIGDEPAYEINEWADEIAVELGVRNFKIPFILVKFLAKIGDFFKIFGIHFPIQSFRFRNMTNDCINDLSATYKLAPKPPFTRKQGTTITVEWMKKHKGKENE